MLDLVVELPGTELDDLIDDSDDEGPGAELEGLVDDFVTEVFANELDDLVDDEDWVVEERGQ